MPTSGANIKTDADMSTETISENIDDAAAIDAARHLIERHSVGQPFDIDAFDVPHRALADIASKLENAGISHAMADPLVEALSRYVLSSGGNFARTVNAKPVLIRLTVADGMPPCRFDRGMTELACLGTREAKFEGAASINVRATPMGTAMTSNTANVDAMFSGIKGLNLWVRFEAPTRDEMDTLMNRMEAGLSHIADIAATGLALDAQGFATLIAELEERDAMTPTARDFIDKLIAVREKLSSQNLPEGEITLLLEQIASLVENAKAESILPVSLIQAGLTSLSQFSDNPTVAAFLEQAAEEGLIAHNDNISNDRPDAAEAAAELLSIVEEIAAALKDGAIDAENVSPELLELIDTLGGVDAILDPDGRAARVGMIAETLAAPDSTPFQNILMNAITALAIAGHGDAFPPAISRMISEFQSSRADIVAQAIVETALMQTAAAGNGISPALKNLISELANAHPEAMAIAIAQMVATATMQDAIGVEKIKPVAAMLTALDAGDLRTLVAMLPDIAVSGIALKSIVSPEILSQFSVKNSAQSVIGMRSGADVSSSARSLDIATERLTAMNENVHSAKASISSRATAPVALAAGGSAVETRVFSGVAPTRTTMDRNTVHNERAIVHPQTVKASATALFLSAMRHAPVGSPSVQSAKIAMTPKSIDPVAPKSLSPKNAGATPVIPLFAPKNIVGNSTPSQAPIVKPASPSQTPAPRKPDDITVTGRTGPAKDASATPGARQNQENPDKQKFSRDDRAPSRRDGQGRDKDDNGKSEKIDKGTRDFFKPCCGPNGIRKNAPPEVLEEFKRNLEATNPLTENGPKYPYLPTATMKDDMIVITHPPKSEGEASRVVHITREEWNESILQNHLAEEKLKTFEKAAFSDNDLLAALSKANQKKGGLSEHFAGCNCPEHGGAGKNAPQEILDESSVIKSTLEVTDLGDKQFKGTAKADSIFGAAKLKLDNLSGPNDNAKATLRL